MEKEDYGPMDVECPACGTMDNHARGRRGLCIWCACALGLEVGSQAFETMPQEELVRRAKEARMKAVAKGTAPRTREMRDAERRDRLEKIRIKAENGDKNAKAAFSREKNRIKCAAYNRERIRQRAAERVAKYGSGFDCDKPGEDKPKEEKPERIYKTSEAQRLRNKEYWETHRAQCNANKRRAYAKKKMERRGSE